MEEGVSEIKEEGENEMTLSVLNPRKLRNYLMKGFRFVHIGHLDVTVTPLTRMNLNTSILVCVVDYRHNQFEQALIAAVEAALDKGKVTFFRSPNPLSKGYRSSSWIGARPALVPPAGID